MARKGNELTIWLEKGPLGWWLVKLASSHCSGLLIRCMCSHFRLLSVCEKELNGGSLQGIDALLGLSQLAWLAMQHCRATPSDHAHRMSCGYTFIAGEVGI